MRTLKFATSEQCFPCWGTLAMKMAREAGFDGIQITDGGGYLQPHPLNPGFVEYERFGLDLRRKDSFPLTDRTVQTYYLEAAEACQIQLTGIYLYLLGHQGFIKFADRTPQGQQCRETIRNAVVSASQMGLPQVTIPVFGMFGIAQQTYAFQKLQYATELGKEYGIRILASMDDAPVERQMEILDRLEGSLQLSLNTVAPSLNAVGDAVEMIRTLGGARLAQIRFQDYAADSEGFVAKETSRPALLGRGAGRTEACAAAAREIGYSGWICSDTPYYSADLQIPGENYAALARRDREVLVGLFGE